MKPKREQPAAAETPRPSRLQMADLARLANVSISTVSRALSDNPRLSAETRQRIHELARSLHYSADAGAQMLRGKSLQTVAVAFPYHAEERQHFKDPFFLALVGAIGDALVDAGHSMLIVAVRSESFELVTKPYETRQCVGTILLGQEQYHDSINALAVRGIPFVVWGARMTDQLYCSVGSDNRMGGSQATAHLLSHGARRIAFIGDRTLPEFAHRYDGYAEAHRAIGLEPDPRLSRDVPLSAPAVAREMDRLIDEKTSFDAVFSCSDPTAVAAMAALRAKGLRVPQDVQVVGYDDVGLAAYANPPLTSVRQDIEAAGKTLVSKLFDKLDGKAVDSLRLPTALAVRESTRGKPDLR